MRAPSGAKGFGNGAAFIAVSLGLGSAVLQACSAPGALVRISFACVKPGVAPPPDVLALIAELMAGRHQEGVTRWGDRSLRLHLRGVHDSIYFVPLSCGITGDCAWALIGSPPARSLGILEGSVVQVRPSNNPWPGIDSFSGSGPGTGTLARHEYRGGAYHRVSVSTLQGDALDGFLSCVDDDSCCPGPPT